MAQETNTLGRRAARWGNAWRRWRHGLPARGGPVSPEVANDLFVAHLATYDFAARFVAGSRVLDLGCGTGYGSAHLLAAGAAAVTGLDSDATAIGYARRRHRAAPAPRLRFVLGRAEDLPGALAQPTAAAAAVTGPGAPRTASPPAPGSGPAAGAAAFDLIVAANLLAHLEAPAPVIGAAARLLGPQGRLLASVPPIADDRTMDQHRAGGVHRTNRYLWDWESLLREQFGELRLFRLLPPADAGFDLADPRRSRLAPAAFRCDEIPLTRLEDAGFLAAIFVASAPRD
jgi:SAM-dependent methyltransferase